MAKEQNFAKRGFFLRFILVLAAFNLLALYAFSEHVTTPLEVVNPHCLRAADGKFFILENGTVFVYDIKTGKFLKKFGRAGEGPGETRRFPTRGNMLRVDDNSVYIDAKHKIVQFSFNGNIIKEYKKPWKHFVIEPLKGNWVTLNRFYQPKKSFETKVTLCSSDLKIKKEYFTHQSNLKDYNLFPDAVNFSVSGDGFFIENSKKGFTIDKYSLDGTHKKTISLDVPAVPVTEKDIEFAYSEIAADPETKAQGGLKNFKKSVNIHIPENFPAIRELSSNNQHLFVMTFKRKKSKSEFYFYEVNGKYLGKTFLPVETTDAFDDYLTGRLDRYYCFYKSHYFYFKENTEDETWEIHKVLWTGQINQD